MTTKAPKHPAGTLLWSRNNEINRDHLVEVIAYDGDKLVVRFIHGPTGARRAFVDIDGTWTNKMWNSVLIENK